MLVQSAGAQATNFTPRAPPRSYDARVHMHSVALMSGAEQKDDERHPFIPQTGESFSPPVMEESAHYDPQPSRPRARDNQKKDRDEAKRVDVRTIIAGADEDRSISAGWNGLAYDVMKLRAADRASKASEKNDGRDGATGENSDGDAPEAGTVSDRGLVFRDDRDPSLWRAQTTVANIARGGDLPQDASFFSQPAADFGRGQAGRDSFSAPAFDAGGRTGGREAGIAGDLRPSQGADTFGNPLFSSQWKSDGELPSRPSPFSDAASFLSPSQNMPAGPSIFSQGSSSLFSHDEAAAKPYSPAPSPAAGDFKRPSALPW